MSALPLSLPCMLSLVTDENEEENCDKVDNVEVENIKITTIEGDDNCGGTTRQRPPGLEWKQLYLSRRDFLPSVKVSDFVFED